MTVHFKRPRHPIGKILTFPTVKVPLHFRKEYRAVGRNELRLHVLVRKPEIKSVDIERLVIFFISDVQGNGVIRVYRRRGGQRVVRALAFVNFLNAAD